MSRFIFWPLTPEAQAQAAGLRAEIAALTMQRAGWRLAGLMRKYSPDQPRVPAGDPDGGQWTNGDDGYARLSANSIHPRRTGTTETQNKAFVVANRQQAEIVGASLARARMQMKSWLYRAWKQCGARRMWP